MRSRRLLVALAVPLLLLAGCDGSPQPGATPTATVSVTASPTPVCGNETALDSWPVSRLAAQTVVVPVNESDVSAVGDLVEGGAGGVILFGSTAPADLGQRLAALAARAPGGIAPFVMTDEEGGDVQRMRNIVGALPSARTMGATMTPEQIRALARQAGIAMRGAGVTMDLAPVLDLDDRPGPNNSNPDGSRSFSRDRTIAGPAGIAFAQGLLDAGVIPVVKHFPGLGGATANTDVAPSPTLPWATLQSDGLVPFADAIEAGVPAVMVANATVPGLSTLPASLSPQVITDVLRGQLGFDGLVMTDSLSGGAISSAGYDVPAASVAALAAGADIILFTAIDVAGTNRQIVAAIEAAVGDGRLTRGRLVDAVGHILELKNVNLCG